MRSWGRRVVISLVLAAATALPAAAEPDPATPTWVPVKATVGAPDGLYLVGEVFFPPIRLCAYRFGVDKVRVIASRAGGLVADDVVTTVGEAQFEPFLNQYGRREMRLEVELPNTLGTELDMQLYAGDGLYPGRVGPGYGFQILDWEHPYRAGEDSTAWIGGGPFRALSFQWGYGTGACYVSPY